MSYLGCSYLSGDGLTAEMAADQSASAQKSILARRAQATTRALSRLTPDQLALVAQRVQTLLDSLPASQRKQVEAAAESLASPPPGGALPGLGLAEGLATIANIGNVLASVAQIGVTLYGLKTAHDDAKDQASAANAQAAAAAAQAVAEQKKADALIAQVQTQAQKEAAPSTIAGIKTSTLLIGGGLAITGLLALFLLTRKRS